MTEGGQKRRRQDAEIFVSGGMPVPFIIPIYVFRAFVPFSMYTSLRRPCRCRGAPEQRESRGRHLGQTEKGCCP
ncbi:MAG: hypothetical protein BAA03_12725 [Caldibacillus debilis]|nr:MAG: hypothetical protein BAA03_12725 [Caldibacillus debilis]